MPLRDHFRGWLHQELNWHSFHNSWATTMAYALNEYLPSGYRASANVQHKIEIDVAAYGGTRSGPKPTGGDGTGAELWESSAGTMTLPFELSEEAAEVLVHGSGDQRYLAAAIELVSDGNKDRPEAREAFVAKCESYLHSGTGLVIFDAVTTRTANLHDELMARLGPGLTAWGERLYCTAYRPSGQNGSARLTVLREALALGSQLPTMPLSLWRGPSVPVRLEETYEDTFHRLRLPTEGPN